MKIEECKYKDIVGIKLSTERVVAIVLPEHGGKIASFKKVGGDREYLLQNKSEKYLSIDKTSDYEKGDCSGFDDMFPTIDAVKVKSVSGEYFNYLDHGEVCRISFDYEVKEDKLVLQYTSPMGYCYQKTFLEEEGKLRIDYNVTNISNIPLDVLWAGHCLINSEKGGQLNFAFSDGDEIDYVSDSSDKFKPFERVKFKKQDFKTIWDEKLKFCNKFYFATKTPKGVIEYTYLNGDVFVMEFDNKKLPYVGVWQNFGRINDSYCFGLEPCTVAYDTVVNAEKYGQKEIIEVGESLKFFIRLLIK